MRIKDCAKIVLLSLILLLLPVVSCSSQIEKSQPAKEPGIPLEKESAKIALSSRETWELEWEKTLEAARVFLNWILSREGQLFMQNSQQLQSARIDISAEGIDPLKIRRPGEKYFMAANTIEEWIVKEQDRYEEIARQVF